MWRDKKIEGTGESLFRRIFGFERGAKERRGGFGGNSSIERGICGKK